MVSVTLGARGFFLAGGGILRPKAEATSGDEDFKHRNLRMKCLSSSGEVHATAAVPPHFNQLGHSMADMELIPLELQPSLSMSRRKALEKRTYR